MEMKCIEVRDEGTCIPMLAIKMEPADEIENRFLWCCGYPRDGRFAVVLMHLGTQKASSDPYAFCGRTWPAAHSYITEHFDKLRHGQVVDVRVVLEEATEAAEPEIFQS